MKEKRSVILKNNRSFCAVMSEEVFSIKSTEKRFYNRKKNILLVDVSDTCLQVTGEPLWVKDTSGR